jgi:hypothetical protein
MGHFENYVRRTQHSLLHVGIELLFAVLPLIVLGAFWPGHDEPHPATLSRSPEWSMTSCILYGLALARFQLGVFGAVRQAAPERGTAVAALSMVPLLGVIFSVILISKSAHGAEGAFVTIAQFVNFVAALVTFVLLGGYGLSRAESSTERP